MHFHVHLKLPHSVVSDKRVSVANRANMATWQYHETKLLLQLWADRNVQDINSNNHLHREEINHYGTICPKK